MLDSNTGEETWKNFPFSHLGSSLKKKSWALKDTANVKWEKKKREINSVLELAHLKVILDEIHNKNTSIYT